MTTLEKINVGKVSGGLAFLAITKARQFGGYIEWELPREIFVTRKSIEFMYANDPTDTDTLPEMENYLITLCQPYMNEALITISGGAGGIVIGGDPPVVPIASTSS